MVGTFLALARNSHFPRVCFHSCRVISIFSNMVTFCDVGMYCSCCRLWYQKLEQEAGGMVDTLLQGTGHEVIVSIVEEVGVA